MDVRLNYINGEWCSATSGATVEVLCPATHQVIATIPRSGPEDVDKAVNAAEGALAGR